jgi:hypothetical protein
MLALVQLFFGWLGVTGSFKATASPQTISEYMSAIGPQGPDLNIDYERALAGKAKGFNESEMALFLVHAAVCSKTAWHRRHLSEKAILRQQS